MEIHANYKLTKEYYKSCWKDWVKYLSIWRVWLRRIGAVVILYSIFLYFIEKSKPEPSYIFSFYIFCCGVYFIILHFLSKFFWLRRLFKAKDTNKEIRIVFTPAKVETIGPYSEGKIDWEGFQKLVPAKNGLFFVMHRGFYIYVPYQAIEEENGKNAIIDMFHQKNS